VRQCKEDRRKEDDGQEEKIGACEVGEAKGWHVPSFFLRYQVMVTVMMSEYEPVTTSCRAGGCRI
jgi:hypothetical protein